MKVFWISGGVDTGNIISSPIIFILLRSVDGINSRMPSFLNFFVLIDFPFQDAIFPFNRGAALSRLLDLTRPGTMPVLKSVPPALRHDECGSKGAKPNEREEHGASPRSRPSPARLRRRASECEILDFPRGAKDLARRNWR